MSTREDSCSPDPLQNLSNLTHHCILHAVEAIAPANGIKEVLPQSGSHNISSFCKEISDLVHECSTPTSPHDEPELIPETTVQKFYSGDLTELQFTRKIEEVLVEDTDVFGIELDRLHQICWEFYRDTQRGALAFPKWLTGMCTYRLWLIFNQCLDEATTNRMAGVTMNEVVKRLIELCSYTWNDSYNVCSEGPEEPREFTFPQFLECITDYFERFSLNTSLTAEVIIDLVDETVHGVLKKGYLEKKGHRRRNWTRRWFILKRTILTYYSKDKQDPKGQLVLNGQTNVQSLPDKSNRRYMFLVTCGATNKPFSISADDQKMKHDWMLAIRKAIALAELTAEGDSSLKRREELEAALSGFFLLKYGTNDPKPRHKDSILRQVKHLTTKRNFKKIEKIARTSEDVVDSPTGGRGSEGATGEELVQSGYVQMHPGTFPAQETFTSSSEDEEGYCRMELANQVSPTGSSSGVMTPSTAGEDSVLTFSLSISGSKDNIFNPDKSGLNSTERAAVNGLKAVDNDTKKPIEQESKAGLEDSFYEECHVGAPRYVPARNVRKKLDHPSPVKPHPQRTIPTPPTSLLPPSASLPMENSYLTILPPTIATPTDTPTADDPPSPEEGERKPPVPLRRCTSPHLSRSPQSPSPEDTPRDPPPPPPPRTKSGMSPVTSPIHSPLPPTPTPPHRKISESPHELQAPRTRSDSVEDKEDVSRFLKTSRSSGDVPGNSRKPIPPPRQH